MKILLQLLLLLLTLDLQAAEAPDSTVLSPLFKDAGVTGTFVLLDVEKQQYIFHDQDRAGQRYVPASTFKIPNSLIGLATGAVESVDEVLPYGGQAQYLKIWEQDMGLREAIKISNVPVYQELARRIGLQRMSEYVQLLDYGNGEIGTTVDTFWLRGPLKISAKEQAQFLAALASANLPLPEDVQADVREIIRIDKGEDWSLYAKTGWGTSESPAIGWWVGWIERQGKIYTFALNIDMPDVSDAKKRVALGKSCLRQLGLLPW